MCCHMATSASISSTTSATKPKKGFNVAAQVDPTIHYTIDRSEWHEDLINQLEKGAYLLLHGSRQSGKSSAAQEIIHSLNSKESPGTIAFQCTLQVISTSDISGMWLGLEIEFHRILRTLGKNHRLDLPIFKRAKNSEPLFTDAVSFLTCFESEMWGDVSVIMILDEFDVLLSADVALRKQFLDALRQTRVTRGSLRTSDSKAATYQTYALRGVLGIGVHRLVQLATERDPHTPNPMPPFNITDAVSAPLASEDDVARLFAEVSRVEGLDINVDVIRAFHRWSGGHVGLISFLGQKLLKWMSDNGNTALSLSDWSVFCGSPYLFCEMRMSATIKNVLQAVNTDFAISKDARRLLRYILSSNEDNFLTIDVATALQRDSLDYLLSEGILRQAEHASADTPKFKLVAPLLVSLLREEVGCNTLAAYMPRTPFPRIPGSNMIDLKSTVWQIVRYIGMEHLFHPLVLNSAGSDSRKAGRTSEYAYQNAVRHLLRAYTSDGGWRVLNETTNSAISHKRLNIIIASNGTRCGLELLVEGVGFKEHVERASEYKEHQRLNNVLVISFATVTTHILDTCPSRPADTVDVVQVLVDRDRKHYVGYELDHTTLKFTPLRAPIREPEHNTNAFAGAPVAEQTAAMSRLSVSICSVRNVLFVLEGFNIGELVRQIAEEFDLSAEDLHISCEGLDGVKTRLAKSQSAQLSLTSVQDKKVTLHAGALEYPVSF